MGGRDHIANTGAGEVVDRSAETLHAPQESTRKPAARPSADGSDERSILGRLVGLTADEALSRLANGDPLKLYARIAHRIRARHHVLDTDRVFEPALSIVAVGIVTDEAECLSEGWLDRRVDQTIQAILERDANDERLGVPHPDPERSFPVFVQAFFMQPHLARGSSVRFNGLEDRVRRAFYHLILEGRPLEEVLAMDVGGPDQLQEDVLRALLAIGLFDEKAYHEFLVPKEDQP